MTRIPVAYIRRSTADAGNPGDVSREVQEQAIRDLAAKDGHNGDVRLYVDWARSADEEKEARRTAFTAMLTAVERGEVSIIYSYALDRLYRSMRTFVRLTDAAKAHDVRIVTQREGVLGGDRSPMALAFAQITAVFSELELNTAKARSQAVAARRVSRGDHFGKPPYGSQTVREADGRVALVPDPEQPIEPLLAAVREAGSVLGACKLIEARGIPAPYGGKAWSTASLTLILQREAPELVNRIGPSGRRQPSRALLGQLVKCHCGQTMTPDSRGGLYCYKGTRGGVKAHGPYHVSERALLPWIVAEAGRLQVPVDVAEVGDQSAERAALEAEREQLGDKLLARLWSSDKIAARAAAIDAELDALDDAQTLQEVPQAIDWAWQPAALGEALRAMWRHVQLNRDMRPVAAEWRKPEWRRA